MSQRLYEECIMAVVRNRSGVDSGEIDYRIMYEKFQNQNERSLHEIKQTLNMLYEKVDKRLQELDK